MSGRQQAVMWIGFILIAFRFFTAGQWQVLWQTISFSGGSSNKKSGGGGATGGNGKAPWDPTGPFSSNPNGGMIQLGYTIPSPGVVSATLTTPSSNKLPGVTSL